MFWCCLSKLTINLPYEQAISLLGTYPPQNWTGVYTKTCTQMLKRTLFVFPKSENNSNWWKYKQNTVYSYHRILYYLTIIRNEVLIHAITWMNLENIMLQERTNHKMAHVIWFHLCKIPRIGLVPSDWVVGWAGCGHWLLRDMGFPLVGDKECSKIRV